MVSNIRAAMALLYLGANSEKVSACRWPKLTPSRALEVTPRNSLMNWERSLIRSGVVPRWS